MEKSKRIIYFVPHQDDEILTMGISIAMGVKNGFDVYVVLCTDGSRSRIRTVLNDGSICEKCLNRHVFPLSLEDFIAARDREFLSSCADLGVKRNNIIIEENRIKDGNLTEENARKIIVKYLDLLGRDSYVGTMYPNDASIQHHDHRNLGLAALKLKNEGKIGRLELMEEPYVVKEVNHNPADEPKKIKARADIESRLENAISEYSLFNPSKGRYAVGYHSVTNELELLKEEKTLYSHIYK